MKGKSYTSVAHILLIKMTLAHILNDAPEFETGNLLAVDLLCGLKGKKISIKLWIGLTSMRGS